MGASTATPLEVTDAERPRLLLDEMLSEAIAARLRDRDVDAVAVVEDASLVATPDEDLLAHAAGQRRVLVTRNISDFAAIANDWRAAGRAHHGLIYIASRAFPQDRSFIGAVSAALASLCASASFPQPSTEVFLARAGRG